MGKNKTKKNAEKVKKVAPPPKPVEESESDDSSSEEEAPVKPTPTKKTKPVKKPSKPAPKEESDDSDESSEEEAPVKKAAPAKKVAAKKEESEDSDDDDSDEDDSDEDMDTAVTTAIDKKKTNGKADDESDEDDDESDEDDESEEEEAPKPKSKKTTKAPKMEVDEDDDSDEDDEEDDSEDEEEDGSDDDDEEETNANNKRKAKKDKSEPPVKKVKASEEDAEACTLFVKHLPESANEKKLKKKFPDAESVRMPMKPDGSNKGFAFIQFSSSEEVTSHLDSHQGCDLDGSSLYLDRVGSKAQKGGQKQAGGNDNSTTLFVKNLPYEVTDGKLKKFFEGATSVRIPTDEEGSSKGFAYVEFGSADDMETALTDKQGAEFGGRALFLDKPRPRDGGNQRGGFRGGHGGGGGGFQRQDGPQAKTKVLFVKNLPFNLEKEELRDAFDGATDARIALHRDTQKPRGFGYVEFNNVEDAESAKKAMTGTNLKGRDIHLDFANERTDSPRGGRGGGGGFRGGRGGGGFRGSPRGRGGDRGRGRGRGGAPNRGKGSIAEFKGSRKSFD